MKFLLVLAVLVVAFWLWRNGRRAVGDESSGQPRPAPAVVPMVACDFCGMHLPETELIVGTRGRYCCQEHRRRHEATPS